MPIRLFLFRISWMLTIPLVSELYYFLNKDNGRVYTLLTGLDRAIPLVAGFIIPYFAWYGFICFTLFWLAWKNARLYGEALASIVTGILVSCVVYIFFQTTVPRPTVIGDDVFSQMILLLYRQDNPYNTFPSIHVLTSFVLFLIFQRTKSYAPKISFWAQVTALLIILSTLFVKQHVVLDVVSGMAFGAVVLTAVRFAFNQFGQRLYAATQQIFSGLGPAQGLKLSSAKLGLKYLLMIFDK